MVILALDAALARCSATLVDGGRVVAARRVEGARGQMALAGMVQAVLAGVDPSGLDGVAVTVGPGSFTGLRSAIALAHGVALGAGSPVVGVSVAEALAAGAVGLMGRALWVAIDTKRGRVFLTREGVAESVALDDLPHPGGPIAVAGDAAIAVFARLAARGCDVMLSDARLPDGGAIAAVGARRLRGEIGPLAAQPLYIDPPEAKLPAGGLRPAPTG
jgi:tRNA threonylcarbamoyl adenosine modification protein YeaZ